MKKIFLNQKIFGRNIEFRYKDRRTKKEKEIIFYTLSQILHLKMYLLEKMKATTR